jgi:hypothetical protein
MPKIFVCYRREDSEGVTGRLYDRLAAHFGRAAIFMDVDTIPFGVDFREHLDQAVRQCDVLLAVIGDRWLESRPASGANQDRRLDDPADFVRIEIQAGLARKVPVIPVLVGRAAMPSERQLPPELADLAYRNAAEVRSGPDFHNHVDRLIRGIERLVRAREAAADRPQERSPPDKAEREERPAEQAPAPETGPGEPAAMPVREAPPQRPEAPAPASRPPAARRTVWRMLTAASWVLPGGAFLALLEDEGSTPGVVRGLVFAALLAVAILLRGMKEERWRLRVALWGLLGGILGVFLAGTHPHFYDPDAFSGIIGRRFLNFEPYGSDASNFEYLNLLPYRNEWMVLGCAAAAVVYRVKKPFERGATAWRWFGLLVGWMCVGAVAGRLGMGWGITLLHPLAPRPASTLFQRAAVSILGGVGASVPVALLATRTAKGAAGAVLLAALVGLVPLVVLADFPDEKPLKVWEAGGVAGAVAFALAALIAALASARAKQQAARG